MPLLLDLSHCQIGKSMLQIIASTPLASNRLKRQLLQKNNVTNSRRHILHALLIDASNCLIGKRMLHNHITSTSPVTEEITTSIELADYAIQMCPIPKREELRMKSSYARVKYKV